MKKVFLLLLAICLIGTVALTAGCGQSGTSDGKSSGQKVLRVGMDFKIRCTGCGHEVMLPRAKIEKNIKKVIKPGQV